jgi:hypothetical protein
MVKKVRTTKADKIWAYKVKHPEASAKEIAKATKSSAAYVWKLMEKIGTPKEVLEAPKNVVMTEHMDLTQKIAEKYTITRKAPEGAIPSKTTMDEIESRSRRGILRKAETLVCKDRAEEHGDAHDNFATTAKYWNAHLGIDWIEPSDVAIMMAMLKMARLRSKLENVENYQDACGYMALGGEMRPK